MTHDSDTNISCWQQYLCCCFPCLFSANNNLPPSPSLKPKTVSKFSFNDIEFTNFIKEEANKHRLSSPEDYLYCLLNDDKSNDKLRDSFCEGLAGKLIILDEGDKSKFKSKVLGKLKDSGPVVVDERDPENVKSGTLKDFCIQYYQVSQEASRRQSAEDDMISEAPSSRDSNGIYPAPMDQAQQQALLANLRNAFKKEIIDKALKDFNAEFPPAKLQSSLSAVYMSSHGLPPAATSPGGGSSPAMFSRT